METQNLSTQEGGGLNINKLPASRIPWYIAALGAIHFLFLYIALAKVVPIFANLFAGLGVDPPLPTRFLIATHSWIFPVLFVGSAILYLSIPFWQLSRHRRRLFTFVFIFVGFAFAPLIIVILYLPMFDLIHKLSPH
jgi:hypothetical protein